MSRLVGFKKYSFTDDKTKAEVKGTNLFFAKDVVAEYGKGIEMEKVSVSDAKLLEVVQGGLETLLNKDCHIQYNRYGKPEYIGLQK